MSTEGQHKHKQFNLNSIIGIICSALVVFSLTKIDHMNTATIELQTQMANINQHVKDLDSRVAMMATQGDLRAVASDLRKENMRLQDEINTLENRYRRQN